ncbi:hypothetical protein [Bacillus infantis]|uniref:hypothetical protein n=1 Tax=Bacillus infantis TaxID=324767 RepID=UPI001653E219|nr:hypothetical protein [Bacillus infantis]
MAKLLAGSTVGGKAIETVEGAQKKDADLKAYIDEQFVKADNFGYTREVPTEGGVSIPKGVTVKLTSSGKVERSTEAPPVLQKGPITARLTQTYNAYQSMSFLTDDILILRTRRDYVQNTEGTKFFLHALRADKSSGVITRGPQNAQSWINNDNSMEYYVLNDTQFLTIGPWVSAGTAGYGWSLELYEVNPETLVITQLAKFQTDNVAGGWYGSQPVTIAPMGENNFVAYEAVHKRIRLLKYDPTAKTFTGMTPQSFSGTNVNNTPALEMLPITSDTFLGMFDNVGWAARMVRVNLVNGTFTLGTIYSLSGAQGGTYGRKNIMRMSQNTAILMSELGGTGNERMFKVTGNPSDLTISYESLMPKWTAASLYTRYTPEYYTVPDDKGDFYAIVSDTVNISTGSSSSIQEKHFKAFKGNIDANNNIEFFPSTTYLVRFPGNIQSSLLLNPKMVARKNSRILQFVAGGSNGGGYAPEYGTDLLVHYYSVMGDNDVYGISEGTTNGVATVKVMGITKDLPGKKAGSHYAAYNGNLTETLPSEPNRIGKAISASELMLLAF